MLAITSFRDQRGIPFIGYNYESKKNPGRVLTKIAPIESKEADGLIRKYYKADSKSSLSSRELTQRKDELDTKAQTKRQIEVYKRFFKNNDKYYISKDRYGNRLIEISPGSVRSTSANEIKCKVYLPQNCLPIKSKIADVDVKQSIMEFKNLFGLTWYDTILIVTYLIDVLRTDTPKLVLQIIGSEGSGKTELAKFLISLLDPSGDQISHISGNIDDIKAYGNSKSILGFDNASTLSKKVQDFLCIISTGGSVPSRKFFTNNELSYVYLKNPIILTSISIPDIRPDLADRMITIDMNKVNRDRLASSKLEAKIEAIRNSFFSAIVRLFSEALTILPSIEIKDLSRMGDFEELGAAISQYLKRKKTFSDIYRKNLCNSAQEAVDNQPTVKLITRLVTTKTPFEGTYSELLIAIREINSTNEPLPKSEKALSENLKRYGQALKKLGFEVEKLPRSSDGHRIQISRKSRIKTKSSLCKS